MILSIKSWRTKKKLRKPVTQMYWPELQAEIFRVYTVYHIIKNWGPGLYNFLRHTGNRKYFSSLSLTRNRREANMFYLVRGVGKVWKCSFWEKGNFIMINKFKYGQTWKFDHLHLVYHFTVPLIINTVKVSLQSKTDSWKQILLMSSVKKRCSWKWLSICKAASS